MSSTDTDPKNQISGSIIPPGLAVKAMRDSGYRNSAYALAEIIDNSIQANATEVELVCWEEEQEVNERSRKRLATISVIDNGDGMSPQTLAIALQFGNGTHLEDRKGIGRFGMGLPNSSISQCKRLDVWTWKNGPDNAVHSYLDVEEILSGRLTSVPTPTAQPVPERWRQVSNVIGTSGTIVQWTKFDEYRLTWRGAEATLRNTEAIIGRMYRRFIDDGSLSIHLVSKFGSKDAMSRLARVNDPMYLMERSSTPSPFDVVPMFQPWSEDSTAEEFKISYDGADHIVSVRFSYAKQETVPAHGKSRGAEPYGKHAAKNIGLSILREGRELDLDSAWTNSYDPTERWWGAEIEFPSALDEIFGVTNNKQSATTLSQMAQYDWRSDAEDGESRSAFIERIQADGDPRALLIPVVEYIRDQIAELRRRTDQQAKFTRKKSKSERHDVPGIEDKVTTKFKERAEDGHPAEADDQEFSEEDKEAYEKDLKDDKEYPDDVAENIASAILERNRKVAFLQKAMSSYAFFDVEIKQGVTNVVFNTKHPFYDQIVSVLHPETDDDTDKDLLDRVNRAADTLDILFAAWARYETEEVRYKDRLFEMRQEWGKIARFFLDDGETE